MERRPYGYAALRHLWDGQERNIGAVVHSVERGFFHLRALQHGDLVRRLRDVPREEIERVEGELQALKDTGRAERGEPTLLQRLGGGQSGRLRLGPVHTGSAERLRWAVRHHFLDYAHPEIAE
jgi:hypothetical protein